MKLHIRRSRRPKSFPSCLLYVFALLSLAGVFSISFIDHALSLKLFSRTVYADSPFLENPSAVFLPPPLQCQSQPPVPSTIDSSSNCPVPLSSLSSPKDAYISVLDRSNQPICYTYYLLQSYNKLFQSGKTNASFYLLLDSMYSNSTFPLFFDYLSELNIIPIIYEFDSIMLGSIVNTRFAILSKFIDDYSSSLDRLWFVDVRDTILQQDVFSFLSHDPNTAFVSYEGCYGEHTHRSRPLYRDLHKWYGEEIANVLRNNSVINGGQLGGSAVGVQKVCNIMRQEFERVSDVNNPWLLDQSALNYLYYSQIFKCKGVNVVPLTVYNAALGIVQCWKVSVNKEGTIVSDRGCPLTVVHWFDRVLEVKTFVDATLGTCRDYFIKIEKQKLLKQHS
ncbi:hypothetical protein RCL1_002433 [Eukaryota sp. TZLM3-RCL]